MISELAWVGQTLNLGYDFSNGANCYTEDTIIHEFMHALGVHHYQNRPDRDDYVWVFTDNIQEWAAHNFDLEAESETFGTEYDEESFMHYRAFITDPSFVFDTNQPVMQSKVFHYVG